MGKSILLNKYQKRIMDDCLIQVPIERIDDTYLSAQIRVHLIAFENEILEYKDLKHHPVNYCPKCGQDLHGSWDFR